MLTSLPNLLTLSRILIIPPIVALFFMDGETPRWVALGLYAAACVTDFFDGYIARSMGQISRFGRFMDPVADKLLVAAVIFMLVATDRITGLVILPALIILIREILVSGLREHLAALSVGVPVSRLAKDIGVWIAALLTLITGYDYLQAGLKHLTGDAEPETPAKPAAKPAKPSGTADNLG
jgi:cardiolipin synthase